MEHHKKNILALSSALRRLESNKGELDLLLGIQVKLFNCIAETEEKNDLEKEKHDDLRRVIRGGSLDREESKKSKLKLKQLADCIQEEKRMLFFWRFFGDAIAFMYLDKWAIKPMMFDDKTPNKKQKAGYISGKDGAYGELAKVMELVESNTPALMNDLTNTLRHGDVCDLSGSDPYVIEVKSSQNTNSRCQRQMDKIQNIHSYLENDEGENIRGADLCMRVVVDREEINYITFINSMISEALANGISMKSPEEGIYYSVFELKNDDNYNDFETHMMSLDVKKAVMYSLNESKNKDVWGCYYPFILSIRNPEHVYAFLGGEICIYVLIDLEVIEKKANEREIGLTFIENDELWAFECIHSPQAEDNSSLYSKTSNHLFNRIAHEFLSVDWFLDSKIDQAKKIDKQNF